MVRELTSFWPGIRPSATISSNSDGETPMYMADSLRERPRRGTGRVSERARAMIRKSAYRSLLPARGAPTVPGFDLLNQVRPFVSTQARKYIRSVGAAFDLRTDLRTFCRATVRQEKRHCVASVFPANPLRYRVATIAALPNEPSEGQAAAGLAALPAVPVHHRKAFAED